MLLVCFILNHLDEVHVATEGSPLSISSLPVFQPLKELYKLNHSITHPPLPHGPASGAVRGSVFHSKTVGRAKWIKPGTFRLPDDRLLLNHTALTNTFTMTFDNETQTYLSGCRLSSGPLDLFTFKGQSTADSKLEHEDS